MITKDFINLVTKYLFSCHSSEYFYFYCYLYQINAVYSSELLRFDNDGVIFYRPTTIAQLKQLKSQHPDAKLFVGNSEVGKVSIILKCW